VRKPWHLNGNSVTDKSTASIERVLNLNRLQVDPLDLANGSTTTNGLVPQSTPILNEDGEPIWKVLVFDNLGRDVISSVLQVNDLRSWGITIHLYAVTCCCLLLANVKEAY
jgi:hypothetical protein